MTRPPAGSLVGRPIGRDIALALVFKLAALSVLYLLFFRADARPTIDADRAARHLLASPASGIPPVEGPR
jgi:hypothetical protein